MKKVFDSKLLTLNFTDSYLKNYSHIKIGEKAEYLFIPKDVSVIFEIIRQAASSDWQILPVGGGSNILFGNTKKRVIISDKNLPIDIQKDNNLFIVTANTNINTFIMTITKQNIGGLEFLAGIPAHIGGLIKMNAAAFGSEISEFVQWIEIINKNGEIVKLDKKSIRWDYRKTNIDDFILKVAFELPTKNLAEIKSDISKFISWRRQKQPLNFPNLGSFFKNPAKISAGELIDRCGLKGTKKGDAIISKKHANFFLNLGNATFSEMEYLIKLTKEKVYNNFNILLELEIEVVN